jgi:ankyrin repeat protein
MKISPEIIDNKGLYYHPLLFDASGAHLIHQVYGHEKYELGRKLVQSFPDFALQGHTAKSYLTLHGNKLDESLMPFVGQNILHMTILRRNYAEVKWLLEFYRKRSPENIRKLLFARATGTFFEDEFYYGETPLQFAVCMNDFEIVDLILSYLASIFHPKFPDCVNQSFLFAPDSKGNNVIHLCVLHNLPDMYDHIQRKAKDIIQQELLVAWHGASHEHKHHYQPQHAVHLPLLGDEESYSKTFGGYLRIPRPIYITKYTRSTKHDIAHQLLLWTSGKIDDDMLVGFFKSFDFVKEINEKILRATIATFIEAKEKNDIHEQVLMKRDFENWLESWERRLERRITHWLYGRDGVYESGVIQQLYEDRLLFCLNEDGLTPITLAATAGTRDMFTKLLNENSFPRWKFGPIQSYIFNLEHIDFAIETVSSTGLDLYYQ